MDKESYVQGFHLACHELQLYHSSWATGAALDELVEEAMKEGEDMDIGILVTILLAEGELNTKHY